MSLYHVQIQTHVQVHTQTGQIQTPIMQQVIAKKVTMEHFVLLASLDITRTEVNAMFAQTKDMTS